MNTKKWTRASVNAMALGILMMAGVTTGCGQSKGSVSMRLSGYTVAQNAPGGGIQHAPMVAERPLFWRALGGLLDLLTPEAKAAISEVRMCFKRLRFKQEDDATASDSSQDEDNVDLELGQVTLDASGTGLGSVTLEPGTYKRLEFDLEDDCGTGYSLSIDNAGVYQTTDRITVKFEGSFQAEEGDQSVSLGVQSIIDALNAVTDSNALRDAAEGASGTL